MILSCVEKRFSMVLRRTVLVGIPEEFVSNSNFRRDRVGTKSFTDKHNLKIMCAFYAHNHLLARRR